MDASPVIESKDTACREAMDLCLAHHLTSWDLLVLNVAAVGEVPCCCSQKISTCASAGVSFASRIF